MKSWSYYNTIHNSERFGWFLYNCLNGIILQLDESHFRIVQSYSDNNIPNNIKDNEFILFLENNGFITDRDGNVLQPKCIMF
jgi:hypothetical protein